MTAGTLGVLAVFFLFAGLMIAGKLPAILALPLMGVAFGAVAGADWFDILNKVLLAGSIKMMASVALVIFGAMFARVVMQVGLTETVIKLAAELAGEAPRELALVLTVATAFVFMGVSGLGAVIMVGSISLPIMMNSGLEPATAGALLLLGVQTGGFANMASYGIYMGLFGGDVAARYYLPATAIAFLVTLVFIVRKVPAGAAQSRENIFFGIVKGFFSALAAFVPALFHGIRSLIRGRESDELTLRRRTAVLSPAVGLALLIPLATVFAFDEAVGFDLARGGIDPIAAAITGFCLAAVYAAVTAAPSRAINILAGAVVEGIRDVAGVIFLFIGIGILVTAVMLPEVRQVLRPLTEMMVNLPPTVFLAAFALLAPLALYRGPLNMYGLGAGVASLFVSYGSISPVVLCGGFLAVQFIQGVSDPTNSHNAWIAGFLGADVQALTKLTLPYSWAMCVLFISCLLVMEVL